MLQEDQQKVDEIRLELEQDGHVTIEDIEFLLDLIHDMDVALAQRLGA